MHIIKEENKSSLVKHQDEVPSPKQICNVLDDYVIGQKCAKEILSLKERLNKIYSKHTSKSVNEISEALERDNFMTADEAQKFGLIDSVVEKRK